MEWPFLRWAGRCRWSPIAKATTSLINTCAFKEKFVPKIKWSLRYLYPRTNAWMSTTWNIKSKQRKIMENQRTSLEFNKQREQQNNVKRPLWHMKKRWKFHHSTSVITEATFNKLQNVWQLQDLMASNDGFQESPFLSARFIGVRNFHLTVDRIKVKHPREVKFQVQQVLFILIWFWNNPSHIKNDSNSPPRKKKSLHGSQKKGATHKLSHVTF